MIFHFSFQFISIISNYITDICLFTSSGQKFPKSREATLEGTVHFSGTVAGPTDPLCMGLTAYIKVR